MKQRRNCKRSLHLIWLAVSPLAVIIPNTLFIIGNLAALAALYGYNVEFYLTYEKQKEDHIADIKIYHQTEYNQKYSIAPMKSQGGYSAVMFFNSLQYFFYINITFVTICLHNLTVGITILFVISIVYIFAEPLFVKITGKSKYVFYILYIAVCLISFVMSKLPMESAFICLWALLFMGKRTSNMIIQKSKSAEKFDKTTMATVKQVGCILGILTAIITSIYLGNTAQELMLILAIISALLSMLCMIPTESGRIKSK